MFLFREFQALTFKNNCSLQAFKIKMETYSLSVSMGWYREWIISARTCKLRNTRHSCLCLGIKVPIFFFHQERDKDKDENPYRVRIRIPRKVLKTSMLACFFMLLQNTWELYWVASASLTCLAYL